MRRHHIVFLVNLLQDVNMVRPLAMLAGRELDADVEFLLSYGFLRRDKSRIWQAEIAQICGQIDATVSIYSQACEAARHLAGKSGVLIAASESSLSNHAETHDVFRAAPEGFLKVTLQHGFECVGFLQNREHDKAHGTSVTFAADVVCGWFEQRMMRSMVASERAKLYVSGPPAVLQGSTGVRKPGSGGLVCENLHSVRLSSSGDFKASFMDIFDQFCARKAERGEKVILRPHPGGQYVIKNKIALPANVELNNRPIYKVKLNQYDFGISAPSSILIDMILAEIPTGVWRDEDGVMDTGNYTGLTEISSLPDWLAFTEQALANPKPFLARQRSFLDRAGMPTDKKDVRRRFLRLLAAGAAPARITVTTATAGGDAGRILIVAGKDATGLHQRLAGMTASGALATETLTEAMLEQAGPDGDALVARTFNRFKPNMLVLCGYDGPALAQLLRMAASRNCPSLLCADTLPAGSAADAVLAADAVAGPGLAAFERLHDAFGAAQTCRLGEEQPWLAGLMEQARKAVPAVRERILVVADTVAATQDISFRRPLAAAVAEGQVSLHLIGDNDTLRDEDACRAYWNRVNPTVLFLSRFTHALETHLYGLAREHDVPVVFHIDDNLLRVSPQLGAAKFNLYNDPARKAALRDAINACDLLYTSTPYLGQAIAGEGITVPIVAGDIYCSIDSDKILAPAFADTPVIGYMGTSGHAADVASIMPAVLRLMTDHPELRFETFGTIKPDPALAQFGDRVAHHAPTANYEAFLARLAQLGWWAGLAPIENHSFNLCKADTKWVEYSLSGVPAVASDLPVYTRACAGGAGLMATTEDDWYDAMARVIADPAVRQDVVERAQDRLRTTYRHDILAEQIFRVIARARSLRAAGPSSHTDHPEAAEAAVPEQQV
ncbi:hypothetical protein [Asticcacaulis solisilvae]|uniref:hypothetical protein n=1 Tax=Asticcacaulis solisilvae TaxID=1217274 RepID=UPI003FD79688